MHVPIGLQRLIDELPYLVAKFVNLLLDLRHAFHLHVEFSENIFHVIVHFGSERSAIIGSRFPGRSAFAGPPAMAAQPGQPARAA